MTAEMHADNAKVGLVLEGGAMRGMFTCGVLDVFMENGICFEGIIGVSAGAAFGCNMKSKQPGRAYRYNREYCTDKRYSSWGNLIKTGDLFDVDFCYNQIPNKLHPWDYDTFESNPTEFYIVATNLNTGKPEYRKIVNGKGEEILWIRASASMPLVSRPVDINGVMYLDGGVSDSVPLKYFEENGYSKNVVILTQPKGYQKSKNKLLPLAKITLRRYPNFLNTMAHRHEVYNENTLYIEQQAEKGDVFLIRPDEPLNISSTGNSPEEIDRVYALGRKKANEVLESVKCFLGASKPTV